jgi:carbonic anhydrase
VAARLATQQLALHGWVYDIESGDVSAVDEVSGELRPLSSEDDVPGIDVE